MTSPLAGMLESALDAEEGVAHLRGAILKAAVSGRLSGASSSEGSEGDLPRGWQSLTLGECVDILDSKRRPINEDERSLRTSGKAKASLYPYYGATRQQGWIDDYLFDEDLVLLGEDGVPFFDPLRPKEYLVSGKSWVDPAQADARKDDRDSDSRATSCRAATDRLQGRPVDGAL